MRVAFYAPMKPPDHPIASGDREIARLIVAALGRGRHHAEIASRYISYQKRPSQELFEQRRADGCAEAARVLARLQELDTGKRPQVWLTYHAYCKSPDWIGPMVTRSLGIPYCTVEACRTRQNTDAEWQTGREIVQAGIRHAAMNFCTKPSDAAYLDEILGPDATNVTRLSPFLDFDAVTEPSVQPVSPFPDDSPLLLAAGMMRPNKKSESFRLLSEALCAISGQRFNLLVLGDGPERAVVEAQFSPLGSRVHFAGAVARADVLAWMRKADLLVWPGYRESIGMVFLEAQANGLPVVALRSLGVPWVVADGETGLLTPEDDAAAYGQAVMELLNNGDRRKSFAARGPQFVRAHHGIDAAAQVFSTAFARLVKGTADLMP